MRQWDQTHKPMGNSEKPKTRMQSFCENLSRRNYPMYGWLRETIGSSEPKSFFTSHWNKRFEFKKTINKITKTVIDLTSELKSEKSNVRIPSGT